jgi:hypothetical protein
MTWHLTTCLPNGYTEYEATRGEVVYVVATSPVDLEPGQTTFSGNCWCQRKRAFGDAGWTRLDATFSTAEEAGVRDVGAKRRRAA